MSVHMPVAKICEKLKKMDSQICELKYGIMETDVIFQYVQSIVNSLNWGPCF